MTNMHIAPEILKLMAHSSLDSGQLTAIKRTWWNLRNLTIEWPFLIDTTGPTMKDLQILAESLTITVPLTTGYQPSTTLER